MIVTKVPYHQVVASYEQWRKKNFKRRLHGTEDARYEAQQQNARAHLNHFQCCAPGVSLL
ncbi:hypothetical protein T01_2113 [Trichinella spiralis]|uniref:Uncharacterized protein n=1 Tax=Trichinella spiralis TaxID=6334 RepID=A0A0V1BPT8_TRISP|nr:hypothetical protein T01_2113 [Trichinella spiralis]